MVVAKKTPNPLKIFWMMNVLITCQGKNQKSAVWRAISRPANDICLHFRYSLDCEDEQEMDGNDQEDNYRPTK